jgi:hypothetical protein
MKKNERKEKWMKDQCAYVETIFEKLQGFDEPNDEAIEEINKINFDPTTGRCLLCKKTASVEHFNSQGHRKKASLVHSLNLLAQDEIRRELFQGFSTEPGKEVTQQDLMSFWGDGLQTMTLVALARMRSGTLQGKPNGYKRTHTVPGRLVKSAELCIVTYCPATDKKYQESDICRWSDLKSSPETASLVAPRVHHDGQTYWPVVRVTFEEDAPECEPFMCGSDSGYFACIMQLTEMPITMWWGTFSKDCPMEADEQGQDVPPPPPALWGGVWGNPKTAEDVD